MSYLFKHSTPKRHKVLCSSCPSKINRLHHYYSFYWKEVFLKALTLLSVILSGIVSHVTSKGTLLWTVLLQWRILRRKFLYTSMYVSIWIFWKWLLQKLVFSIHMLNWNKNFIVDVIDTLYISTYFYWHSKEPDALKFNLCLL